MKEKIVVLKEKDIIRIIANRYHVDPKQITMDNHWKPEGSYIQAVIKMGFEETERRKPANEM